MKGQAQAISSLTLLVAVVLSSLDFLGQCGANYLVGRTRTIDRIRNLRSYKCSNSFTNTSTETTDDTSCTETLTTMGNFLEMSSMCPGAAEYLTGLAEQAMFQVSVSDCSRPGFDVRSQHGVVYGTCNDSTTFCQFLVQVARDMIVRAEIKLSPSDPVRSDWETWLYNGWSMPQSGQKIQGYVNQFYLSTANQMYLLHYNSPTIHIQFQAVTRRLQVVHTSDNGGYVTSSIPKGFSLQEKIMSNKLIVPEGSVIMISFEIFRMLTFCFKNILLKWRDPERAPTVQRQSVMDDSDRLVYIYNTQYLEIHVFLLPIFPKDFDKSCIKMLFSFHLKTRVPQRLSNGLFNCSVDDYWRFRQHLDCNLKVHCEDGRDETGHCPFSSSACKGWVAAGHKCYKQLTFARSIHVLEAIDRCRKHGLRLASIQTSQELAALLNIFKGRYRHSVLTGLFSGLKSNSFMYKSFYMWSANTPVYNLNYIDLPSFCRHALKYYQIKFHFLRKNKPKISASTVESEIICEKYVSSEDAFNHQSVEFSTAWQSQPKRAHTHPNLATCPERHMTHTFLVCDLKSRCGHVACTFRHSLSHTPDLSSKMTWYSCSNGGIKIPYTLVCDFRQDCQNGRDEKFCQHPSCEALTCSNGQCVSSDKKCNNYPDCLDESDESDCSLCGGKSTAVPKVQKVLINLDGKGYFTQREMNRSESCPDTHYRCEADLTYCLPVYTRCNGFFDCVFREDEKNCEMITCPGFYRCRDSSVCVHVDHLCDGWSQCPQRDDEWLCNVTCPLQCLCQGHAFLCSQPFPAHLFPQLRYLDAHRSGMSPSDLWKNIYIIHLSFSQCSIMSLSDMKFPNLKFMDLSNNQITSIVLNIFLKLENLQILYLRGNPLSSVVNEATDLKQNALQRLDLSQTHLEVFDSQCLRPFPGIQYLNVSWSSIKGIGSGGFQSFSFLKEVDMRENSVKRFPPHIFRGLNKLAIVLSPDYRLCCKGFLPNNFPAVKCTAPSHILSSCEKMLQSTVYAATFWFIAIFASTSSCFCFVVHYAVKESLYTMSTIVLLVSLQCADLCLAVYAIMIAAADETFRGVYSHHEDRWKDSLVCKVTGFFSLLSSEESFVTVFLLTLQHLIDLSFPLSRYSFSRRSAAVACGLTWLVTTLMASLPLFPGLSHWGHYGQTAVCNLMLLDRPPVKHEFRFFHAVLVFNCIISLIMSACQVIVYRATPSNKVLVNCCNNPVLRSVDLCMRIAVTESLGWFLATITSALTFAGVVGSENVSVAMAVMLMPLNSSVKPLLCLLHEVTYRRRQKHEQRLLSKLKSECKRKLKK